MNASVEEVLHVAADIKAAAHHLAEGIETTRETDHFVQEWLDNVGEGVPGYVTPKLRSVPSLAMMTATSCWCSDESLSVALPTGWADVGYSPSEVAVKEVEEETGIICEPVRLLSVIDGQRMGFSRFGMYMLLFHCRATGGTLEGHPLETSDVGWFSEDALPEVTAAPSGGVRWHSPQYEASRWKQALIRLAAGVAS